MKKRKHKDSENHKIKLKKVVLKLVITQKGDKRRVAWILDDSLKEIIIEFVNKADYETSYQFVEQRNNKIEKSKQTEFTLRRYNYQSY